MATTSKVFSPRRPQNEINQIRKKIGLRNGEPFPKCPHKNTAKAKRLAKEDQIHFKGPKVLKALLAAGEDWHAEPEHRCKKCKETDRDIHQCSECQCDRVRGAGTIHYGWGWCSHHEKHKPKGLAEKFARDDLVALQNHNPSMYWNADRFATEMGLEVRKAEERLTLLTELSSVRTMQKALLERFELVREDRKSPVITAEKHEGELPGLLTGNYIKIKETKGSGENQTTSERIEAVEITDLELMRLINQTALAVSKIAKTQVDMDKDQYIHIDEFKILLGRMLSDFRKRFSIQEDQDAIMNIFKTQMQIVLGAKHVSG